MASVLLTQHAIMDIDGVPHELGDATNTVTITLGDDEVSDQTFKIAASGITKIWDKTENEAMGDYDFLWIQSDRDVWLQLTTDAGGANEKFFVKKLSGTGTAGSLGPAFVDGNDDAQDDENEVIDTFAGTADTIDEIWAYNADSANVARVRRFVGT